jgi:hypothetical protein
MCEGDSGEGEGVERISRGGKNEISSEGREGKRNDEILKRERFLIEEDGIRDQV